jgi:glycerophosphoryl diester phosphodiesterase
MSAKLCLSIIAVIVFVIFCNTYVVDDERPTRSRTTMARTVDASNSKRIILIAHRGSPQTDPENSIAGYRSAINQGAMFIEFDLVISRDGVIYISHDYNLKRTTGNDILVSAADSNELDRIKLRNGEKLPRLSELFEEFGDSVLYIAETKQINELKDRQMDKTLIDVIREYRVENRVMLQSQSMSSLKTLHRSLERVPYMYIVSRASRNSLIKKIKRLPRWIDVVCVSCKMASKRSVKVAHKHGVKVALFTIKDRKDMREALKYSSDMICTDNFKMSSNYLIKKRWKLGRKPAMGMMVR